MLHCDKLKDQAMTDATPALPSKVNRVTGTMRLDARLEKYLAHIDAGMAAIEDEKRRSRSSDERL